MFESLRAARRLRPTLADEAALADLEPTYISADQHVSPGGSRAPRSVDMGLWLRDARRHLGQTSCMPPAPPPPARFLLVDRCLTSVRVRLQVPRGVIVRDVFLGFLPPGAAVTAENLDPGGVVDATQSGVEQCVHNYAFESVGCGP
jgi:hypothetical protein